MSLFAEIAAELAANAAQMEADFQALKEALESHRATENEIDFIFSEARHVTELFEIAGVSEPAASKAGG